MRRRNPRRTERRLVAFALLCAGPLTAASIEGRVTNSVTGEAVSGAKVRFLERRSHTFETVTDGTGGYRLTQLADGDYRGEVSKEGFSDFRSGSSLAGLFNGTGSVHLSGDVPARLDVQLQPWGLLRGRVADEDGQPAVRVAVEISRDVDSSAVTDESGEFAFPELRPGSYTVVAKPKAVTRMRDGECVGTVPIYYPSATQLVDALPINVTWGAEVAGIEIRLKSVPVQRVAGVVLDQAGKPVAHTTVKLMGHASALRQGLSGGISGPGPFIRSSPFSGGFHIIAGPGPEPELASMESRDDGSFDFAAVERGDWRLTADIDLDAKPRSGVGSAVVGDKDVEGVQIRISPPFSVEVTADWGDTQPPKTGVSGPVPTAYLVHLIPVEGQPQLDFDTRASVTSINHAFPGRYRVSALHSPDGFYAGRLMFGGTDVRGQVVELAPGAGPLHIIVKHDTGSLRGMAENGKGATAFLVSTASEEIVDAVSAPCGPNGTFEFKNVVPGDYYVVAFDRSDLLLPPNSVAQMATRVTVEPGATASVNLTVYKWPW